MALQHFSAILNDNLVGQQLTNYYQFDFKERVVSCNHPKINSTK